MVEGLEKAGFRLNDGMDGAGTLLLALTRFGGYYIGTPFCLLSIADVLGPTIADVGTSKLIADGKIKLKNDSPIARFTASGLEFENGGALDADVVIFATGYVATSVTACGDLTMLQ
jgi:hypothetical protein